MNIIGSKHAIYMAIHNTECDSEVVKEKDFWTKEEYLKFSEAMMDKPRSYYAFEMLYGCGIRLGESLMLAN